MKIAKALEPLVVPIDSLTRLPNNPRHGDVPAMMRILDRFGQLKPIVVHKRGREMVIIAGNHTHEAAVNLGWTGIARTEFRGTRKEADAFALGDNRISELGTTDEAELLAMADSIDDAGLLLAAAFTSEDISALRLSAAPITHDADLDDIPERPPPRNCGRRSVGARAAPGDVWRFHLAGPRRAPHGRRPSRDPVDGSTLRSGVRRRHGADHSERRCRGPAGLAA